MKLEFRGPPKAFEKIRECFRKHWDSIKDAPWGADYGEGERWAVMLHSTGNRWEVVRLADDSTFLRYEGSRAGFRSFTPFVSAGAKVRTKEDFLILEIEGKKLPLKLETYETSHPYLAPKHYWSCEVLRLEEEPDRAVVLCGNTAMKVVPYKNVYREPRETTYTWFRTEEP